jgi:putative oxidoreductase
MGLNREDSPMSSSRLTVSVGRACVALIFLSSGVHKLGHFGATAARMAEKGIPLTPLFLAGAIAIELSGGLALLTGRGARLGAALLAVFLVPTTLLFHAFWTLGGTDMATQRVHFLKNVAILGALLLVYGTEPDARAPRG